MWASLSLRDSLHDLCATSQRHREVISLGMSPPPRPPSPPPPCFHSLPQLLLFLLYDLLLVVGHRMLLPRRCNLCTMGGPCLAPMHIMVGALIEGKVNHLVLVGFRGAPLLPFCRLPGLMDPDQPYRYFSWKSGRDGADERC